VIREAARFVRMAQRKQEERTHFTQRLARVAEDAVHPPRDVDAPHRLHVVKIDDHRKRADQLIQKEAALFQRHLGRSAMRDIEQEAHQRRPGGG